MNKKQQIFYITAMFALARLILFISSPIETVTGYGDYWNFYQQAKIGWPFLDHWTEFPPIFPLLNKLLYIAVSGRETAYYYLLAIFISLFQAGSVILVGKLEQRLVPDRNILVRTLAYAFITAPLFYSWSYFDPLAVFFMLQSVFWFMDKKNNQAVGMLVMGVLVKWFPFLAIPAIIKINSRKDGLKIIAMTLIAVFIVWGSLSIINTELTEASLVAQANKGSWETVWALIDGNLGTGNFSGGIDRRLAASAQITTGASPVISPWITLVGFGVLGLFLLQRTKLDSDYKVFAFIGLTMVIFFLWSPGYSPQWVLYLLPFAILVLPGREALLFSASYLLINLLEWPILLSRGNFESLFYLIPARTLLLVLLGVLLYQSAAGNRKIAPQNGRYEI